VTDFVLTLSWSVVVFPFALAVVIAAVGRRTHRAAVPVIASLGPMSLVAVGAAALTRVAGTAASSQPWTSAIAFSARYSWLSAGDHGLPVGYAIDSLAAVMLVVVGVVALCVMVFSAGYLAEDDGWNRYYALLCLFTGSMAGLVIADSFVSLFIGWELVGACSYLLIGFWYRKSDAVAAAVKAFLTTRVGDVALMLGLAVLWSGLGSLQFEDVARGASTLPMHTAAVAAVLVALGAMGKSAQFPFHGWLPDAMEGPTPVSALIHAATMVAAAPVARMVLLLAGVTSALGAGIIAVVQRDIKKVLAYSTISQLGFMFAALGVGAWDAAFFHLVMHAGFKALLFLTAGSLIHGAGTQDLTEMGGLRRRMPITFVAWIVGTGALIGVPGFSGFFSKDAVIERVWYTSTVLGVALVLAAGLTALYMARATRLAFFGESVAVSAHESPPSMLIPLLVLVVPAIGAGYAGNTLYGWLSRPSEPIAWGVASAALLVMVLGASIGWGLARRAAQAPPRSAFAEKTVALIESGFYWDAAVSRLIVEPTVAAMRALWAVVDRLITDGLVEGSAAVAQTLGSSLSRLQSGNAQTYSAVMVFGVLAMLAASAWFGR
jgi:NADH-quinone oxidoreductase subunit L